MRRCRARNGTGQPPLWLHAATGPVRFDPRVRTAAEVTAGQTPSTETRHQVIQSAA